MHIRKQLWQTLRFLVVGGLATLTYAVTGLICVQFGTPLMLSHALALITGNLASYFGHKKFTFRVAGDHHRTGPRYILVSAFLIGTQTLIIAFAGFIDGVSDSAAILIGTVYYPPASYLIHSLWTFRKAPVSRP